MSALAQQAAFANWLARPASASREMAPVLVDGVDAGRLAIHRNNFVLTLVDALVDAFPVTRALAGVSFFRSMARQRVLADPPRSPVVTEYASGFPHFIGEYPPAAAVPYLASVARLEGLCVRAYHSADAAPVPVEAFRALLRDPEQLARTSVRLHPAARWMRSRYAVHRIWSAHQSSADMSAAELRGVEPLRPEAVLVVRPALDVLVALLPPGGFMFLDSLSSGLSLQSAVSDARHEAPGADVAGLFSMLVRFGLVIELIDTQQDLQ